MTLEKGNGKNRIHFVNAIISNRIKRKGEQNLIYNLMIWKKSDAFDIINDISKFFTLVQLTELIGNVNNAISIVGHWIFDLNHKKALFLTQESLDIICYPSIGE